MGPLCFLSWGFHVAFVFQAPFLTQESLAWSQRVVRLWLTCIPCPEILSVLSVPPTAWSGNAWIMENLQIPLPGGRGSHYLLRAYQRLCSYLSSSWHPLSISPEHLSYASSEMLLSKPFKPRTLAYMSTYYLFFLNFFYPDIWKPFWPCQPHTWHSVVSLYFWRTGFSTRG